MSRLIIDRLMRETVQQAKVNTAGLCSQNEQLWQKIRASEFHVVAMPRVLEKQVGKLVNDVLLKQVYREPRVMLMLEKAKTILGILFQTFMSEPRTLPTVTQGRLAGYFAMTKEQQESEAGGKTLARVVADYISGMTDKYAMDTYQVLTQAYEKAL